jgi:hypothetical protein
MERNPESMIWQMLKGLPVYVQVNNLPYGNAHTWEQHVP